MSTRQTSPPHRSPHQSHGQHWRPHRLCRRHRKADRKRLDIRYSAHAIAELPERSARLLPGFRMSYNNESPNAAQDLYSNPAPPPAAARGRREWLIVVGVLVVALVLLLGSVFFLPGFLVERDLGPGAQLPPAELVNATNNVRSTLLQAIAGL